MQTFLPFPSFRRSAEVLDDRRLGKQRVETLQILRALHCEGYGWRHHPAVTMWRGYTDALVSYGTAVVDEWVARGYDDTTREAIAEFVHPDRPRAQERLASAGRLPPWLGDARLHRSHRAALLRKDRGHYGGLLPATDPDLEYVWPQPPAPEPDVGPRSAWVLRGIVEGPLVFIPAEPGEEPTTWQPASARRPRKRHRQVVRLREQLAPGDVVVVPGETSLDVGVVTAGYRYDDRRGAHAVPVRWTDVIARSLLRFPAALQDPQVVFALHDETVIEEAATPR